MAGRQAGGWWGGSFVELYCVDGELMPSLGAARADKLGFLVARNDVYCMKNSFTCVALISAPTINSIEFHECVYEFFMSCGDKILFCAHTRVFNLKFCRMRWWILSSISFSVSRETLCVCQMRCGSFRAKCFNRYTLRRIVWSPLSVPVFMYFLPILSMFRIKVV
jgi:hypothetical protein